MIESLKIGFMPASYHKSGILAGMGNNDFKTRVKEGLMAESGAKLPTSSLGRLGRGARAALRSGGLIWQASRNKNKDADPDASSVDLEKVVKVVTSLGQLKGIAMKMGQIMSYIDIALPEELRDALSVLQTHAQPMPFDQVAAEIRTALPKTGDALLERMEEAPVAAASIGQVHRAVLPDGTAVAVKIQYPEAARAIAADFGPASAGTRIASLFYPKARIDDFVKEARTRFLEECDYRHEAYCQRQFRALFDGHEVLFVPDVFDAYCADTVLTSTFVEGLSFADFLATDPPQSVRDRTGAALFEFYLGTLFRHCLYNCDPHPGNYLFCEDGRVAMLDHGCTRQFDPRFVSKLAGLTRAMHADVRDDIHRALVNLEMVRDNERYDFDTIRGFLRAFFGPMLEDRCAAVDMSAAMEMREAISAKHRLMKIRMPGEFLFLFRIRFGLMSVLAKLGAEANWYALETQYVDDFSINHPLYSV